MAYSENGAMVTKTILKVPCRFRDLSLVREIVLEKAFGAGLTEEQASQLEMAVDEACTNIIEHSYGGELAAARFHKSGLVIHLLQFQDRFVVEIFDHGAGFNMEEHPPISPAEWMDAQLERGLGLYIIQHFVDDIRYERGTRDGNYLRLTKRF